MKSNSKNFRIVDGKGFQITFANGWTISVQFGRYNYCDAREYTAAWGEPEAGAADTAEIAAWPADGKFCRHVINAEHDDVIGWQTPADFVAIISRVAVMPRECDKCIYSYIKEEA